MGEFDLIAQYFAEAAADPSRAQVDLGIGDDCALLQPENSPPKDSTP